VKENQTSRSYLAYRSIFSPLESARGGLISLFSHKVHSFFAISPPARKPVTAPATACPLVTVLSFQPPSPFCHPACPGVPWDRSDLSRLAVEAEGRDLRCAIRVPHAPASFALEIKGELNS